MDPDFTPQATEEQRPNAEVTRQRLHRALVLPLLTVNEESVIAQAGHPPREGDRLDCRPTHVEPGDHPRITLIRPSGGGISHRFETAFLELG